MDHDSDSPHPPVDAPSALTDVICNCGYSLKGHEGERVRCPECGTWVNKSELAQKRAAAVLSLESPWSWSGLASGFCGWLVAKSPADFFSSLIEAAVMTGIFLLIQLVLAILFVVRSDDKKRAMGGFVIHAITIFALMATLSIAWHHLLMSSLVGRQTITFVAAIATIAAGIILGIRYLALPLLLYYFATSSGFMQSLLVPPGSADAIDADGPPDTQQR